MTIITRRNSSNKQKASTEITVIVPQDFMNLSEEFKDLPYLGYRKEQVKGEDTKAYFLLVYQILNKNKHVVL